MQHRKKVIKIEIHANISHSQLDFSIGEIVNISIEFKKINLSNMLKFLMCLIDVLTLIMFVCTYTSSTTDPSANKGKGPMDEEHSSNSRRSTSDG